MHVRLDPFSSHNVHPLYNRKASAIHEVYTGVRALNSFSGKAESRLPPSNASGVRATPAIKLDMMFLARIETTR